MTGCGLAATLSTPYLRVAPSPAWDAWVMKPGGMRTRRPGPRTFGLEGVLGLSGSVESNAAVTFGATVTEAKEHALMSPSGGGPRYRFDPPSRLGRALRKTDRLTAACGRRGGGPRSRLGPDGRARARVRPSLSHMPLICGISRPRAPLCGRPRGIGTRGLRGSRAATSDTAGRGMAVADAVLGVARCRFPIAAPRAIPVGLGLRGGWMQVVAPDSLTARSNNQ